MRILAVSERLADEALSPEELAAALAPNQANLLSFLYLIAGSVLASSAKDAQPISAPQCEHTAEDTAAPDPPELVPEDEIRSIAAQILSSVNDFKQPSHDQKSTATKPKQETPDKDDPPPVQCEGCAKKQKAEGKDTSEPIKPATEEPPATDQKSDPEKQQNVKDSSPTQTSEEPATSADKTSSLAAPVETEAPGVESKTPQDAATPAAQTVCETPPSKTAEPASKDVSDTAAAGASQDAATAAGAVESDETVVAVTAEVEANAGDTATTEVAELPSDLSLPSWFLASNVMLHEELLRISPNLELFESKPGDKTEKPTQKLAADTETDVDSVQKKQVDGLEAQSEPAPAKETTCTCKKVQKPESSPSEPAQEPAQPGPSVKASRPVYQIHKEIYDEALDLFSAALQAPTLEEKENGTKALPAESWVSPCAFLLQSPKDGSLDFLDETIHQVARDIKADVISLDLEDLEDLCHHFWHESEEVRTLHSKYLTSATRLVGHFFGYSMPTEKGASGISCILNGATAKREGPAKAAGASTQQPAGSQKNTGEAATVANSAATGGISSALQPSANGALAAEILQAGVRDAFFVASKILQEAIAEAFAQALTGPGSAVGVQAAQNLGAEDRANNSNAAAVNTSGSASQSKDDSAPATKPRPLIVVIRGADVVGKMTPLQRLSEGIKQVRRDSGLPVIAVGTAVSNSTSDDQPTEGIKKVWDGFEITDSTVVTMIPRNTRRAAEALKQQAARTKPRTKWRLLRRAICVALYQHPSVSVSALYPSGPPAGERVVDEVENEELRQMIADWDDKLSARVVRQVSARGVRTGAVTPADILDLMRRLMRNQAVINKMNEAGDDEFVAEDGSGEEDNVKFGGPVKKSKVKSLLARLEDSCSDAEKEYFDCVIDTEAIAATSDDIHMDQSLMESLKQLLALRQSKPYGLLAKEAVNGAILYGPPGTGKTHLARVVAASAGTNLIVATPADMQSMWVGETEKRIKALFSLGTKLSPCVVFIDEGDSVFGKRQCGEYDWQRKAMSQLLMEMDGLVSRKKAPFLMVATNRPGDIDDAVCRRLPHTLHIGMPTAAGRLAILKIYLKDEKLDEKLKLDEIASENMTKGFSGSDIKTLCVQAAMAAQKEIEEANNQDKEAAVDETKGSEKRVITMEHFKKALERTRPSVTRESLMQIELFTSQDGKNNDGQHQAMYI